eukprot:3364374-Alexandrium_andersonii.AAC.1
MVVAVVGRRALLPPSPWTATASKPKRTCGAGGWPQALLHCSHEHARSLAAAHVAQGGRVSWIDERRCPIGRRRAVLLAEP